MSKHDHEQRKKLLDDRQRIGGFTCGAQIGRHCSASWCQGPVGIGWALGAAAALPPGRIGSLLSASSGKVKAQQAKHPSD